MTLPYGVFISFEGGEGAGKSSQIARLCATLKSCGIDHIRTREPGGCVEAETLRDLLVRDSHNNWTPKTELMLMNAARHEHLEKVIRPALKDGRWVICDRFCDSSLVYQGYARGMDLSVIEKYRADIVGSTMPNLTFVLDVDPMIGIPRSRGNVHENGQVNQETRFENLEMSFHEKVREGFKKVVLNDPDRCHLIDAHKNQNEVYMDMMSILLQKYPLLSVPKNTPN
ncbi:MAG: dTMP kinase [Magnetococcales bacterium]|nr:dTMP kinase [Magnetococcales bacterium]